MLSALNQIFKTHYLILSIYLILTANNLAQMEGYYNCVPDEGVGTLSIEAIQMGGRYIPSRDTFHVLVVFVQFPDDNFDTTNTLWPKGQPPTYLNTFVDLNASINSQNGNMTHYFRQMSMNKFKLTGEGVHIIAPHTRYWYQKTYKDSLSKGSYYGFINRDVLIKVDSTRSFEAFDKWIRGTNYNHDKGQDSIVDMIFMLYRNVGLDSTQYGSLVFPGTAWLGLYQDLDVDNGARVIDMGSFPGSGTTSVMNASNDGGTLDRPNYRVQIHELTHFFFGGNSWHNGGGFWSLFRGSRVNSANIGCANSLERELLGWIAPDSITQNTLNITLTDFATTGSSVKIKVPGSNSNEYFRLEYHTRASQFDTPEMHDPNAKGLYILHQTGLGSPEDGWMRLLPADGRWTWISDEYVYRDYYEPAIPVLEKTGIDRVNGIDDSRAVTYTWTGGSHPPLANPFWIHVYRDRATNELIDKTVFTGDGQDAFGLTKNNIFSPWSNPNSQDNLKQSTGIAFEVINENAGVCTLNIYFGETAAQNLAPSKPQDVISSLNSQNHVVTTWAANIEDDVTNGGGYNIYREIYYGTTVVSDIKLNSSLITGTSYTDDNITLSAVLPNGVNLYARYKIEAVDNTAKVSLKALGNPIFLGITQQVSGTISSTTWTGVKFVTGNVTVNSGNTLTVSPNTFVFFTSGKQLIIHGKIDADNSTFQALSGVAHYGILVDGTVKSYFNNCNLKGSTYGLIVGGSTFRSPEVMQCYIQGNTAGVWIRTSGDPWIQDSYIKATSNTASVVLAINNSIGTFVRCKLYGTARYGHKNDNSSATMYGYYNEARNIIDGTNFSYTGGVVPAGIYVTGGYPYFTNGKNYIVYRGSYYYQYHNVSPNSQNAIGNYWGGTPVVVGQVTTTPVLTQVPNPIGPSWTLPKTLGGEEEITNNNDLSLAWEAYFDGDYHRSKELAQNVFQAKNKTDRSGEALFLWMRSSLQEKSLEAEESTLSSFSKNSSIHESAKYESLRWLAKLAVYEGDFKKAEEYALTIPNSSSCGREILLDLAVEILERWSDIDKAALVLDKLVELYPDKETAREKEFVLDLYSEYISQMGSGSDEPGKLVDGDVSALNLLDAFPNPFNPMTTIQFQLPTSQNYTEMEAFVSLKVYDILGNEVATLVNEMKKPGNYKVTFDASELASGMYIYRLQTNSASGGFVSCKKIILVK